ncbi:TPA: hypothetical protein MBH48_001674 [Klebsiella pneumoniae]|nr:hypothetical protein [Klebsiella pneumoniae]OVU20150.1 hypothetical protein BMD94_24680 [Klebsiella pneumoniae]OVU98190.1 hypothetical protein BME04_28410 [Klebsiella pneumoniae]OVY12745.1 hypothetical protein BME72_19115 [Klebsiella pneumoniae]OVY13626.1 hypothetical protein BME75_08510 [Klebsiella pneumoniae]HBT3500576.1 hypothetical protein [Klebsiella pneumoniae]
MTTDITELVQLRGRTVDYPYYLVECDCGKIYPSSELSGGEPMGDSGDYSDCYCPHCGEGEEHFAECADPETAWKAQQDKIDALVEALEKAKTKADVYDMLRDDYGLREKGVGLVEFVDWQANRIAELEESHAQVIQSRDHYKRMSKEGLNKLAESRTVKLPPKVDSSNVPFAGHTWNCCLDEVEKCLTAAGIKVEAE